MNFIFLLFFKSISLFAMYPLDTIQATDWLLVWYCQQMNRWITIQLGIQSPPQGRYVTKSEPLGSLLDSNCLHWRLSAQLLGNRFCKKQTKQKHFCTKDENYKDRSKGKGKQTRPSMLCVTHQMSRKKRNYSVGWSVPYKMMHSWHKWHLMVLGQYMTILAGILSA